MQGIEQFGDFAIQIRTKMMTIPGEQFVIRRKALVLIKKAFDENGIKFAFPTVQVAPGETDARNAVVARQGLELVLPAADRILGHSHVGSADMERRVRAYVSLHLHGGLRNAQSSPR